MVLVTLAPEPTVDHAEQEVQIETIELASIGGLSAYDIVYTETAGEAARISKPQDERLPTGMQSLQVMSGLVPLVCSCMH
jgi:hypothetical protein